MDILQKAHRRRQIFRGIKKHNDKIEKFSKIYMDESANKLFDSGKLKIINAESVIEKYKENVNG